MAIHQWAIAHCGSSLAISRNSFSASSYQNECSRATPRAKGFCTAAVQETGKCTVPSCVSLILVVVMFFFVVGDEIAACGETEQQNPGGERCAMSFHMEPQDA